MQIRVISSVLLGGIWHEPGIGNYEPGLAQHLINIGAAEKYETKVTPVTEKKTQSFASQPAPVSQKKTAKKPRGRPRKSSR